MGNRRDDDWRGGGARPPRDDPRGGRHPPRDAGRTWEGAGRGPGHDTSRDWHVAPGRPRAPWYPSRDLERDREYRTLRGDRDRLDYEIDRDFADSARQLDRARGPARGRSHDDYYRALDRRARDLDPERIARRPGYSPSGTFRALDEPPPRGSGRGGRDPRDEARFHRQGEVGRGHSRYGQRGVDAWDEPEAWLDELRELRPRERPAEADVRQGGTQPSGHGPGVENMAPPVVGFSTSRSRRDDHELGHGGHAGGARPPRPPVDSRRAATARGPRGYQRADARIHADICDRLMQDWMDVSDVEVRVEDGVVTLLGRVRGRDEKRAIEDVADAVLGVKEVLNQVRLDRTGGVLHGPASQEPLEPLGDAEDERGPLHS